ncbi:Protein of unknown function DUF473 [Methanococcus aeolicus Nankai-3]|jgi:hypothetical protein|uniref:DUF473 domain-containing protein n=1 Tax=Methanococcus aeolicus (strain ATCC BAA-1280 / DSM 17508 / OCM 812 / Nankai-3) TaxID=419665 RepID=A6UT47_META3|nr:DUF473 domain-containing protein [Methanococcus aeolicus]ABR55669.1 Protein of unknown function DUF473 [Methanococcus aeolicus Nankai-3]
MKVVVLTGIAPEGISKLVNNHLYTFNLKNFTNIIAITSSLDIGDFVFLTEMPKEDTIPGTEGVIAQIKSLKIVTQKEKLPYNEETEYVIAKIQLEVVGYGACVEIMDSKELLPITATVKINSIYN